MADRATQAERRRALDEMVIAAIRDGAHRFSIISGRIPSAMTGGISGPHWRAVDRSLQRLRKAGRIVCRGNTWSVMEVARG